MPRMPGLHTFYDGSMILEPLADRIGVEVDKVRWKAALQPAKLRQLKFVPILER